MQHFSCPHCGNTLYFENVLCEVCKSVVGYHLDSDVFRIAGVTLEGVPSGYHYCSNAAQGGCNWVLPDSNAAPFCLSCSLNEVIPPIADPVHRQRWANAEAAKHRLIYTLHHLDLPVVPKAQDPSGLAFRILVDAAHGGQGKVIMGHADGVITIDAAEADPDQREERRVQFAEPYRTMLGHMRHESAHYYWNRLIEHSHWLEECRRLFGDERADYGETLKRYYDNGSPPDWQQRFISAYASAHPWEDWAETWAHYLHMVDVVETAAAVRMGGLQSGSGTSAEEVALTAQQTGRDLLFEVLRNRWLKVVLAMNSMNRSMGHPDFYPFVITDPVVDKLHFVHRVIHEDRNAP